MWGRAHRRPVGVAGAQREAAHRHAHGRVLPPVRVLNEGAKETRASGGTAAADARREGVKKTLNTPIPTRRCGWSRGVASDSFQECCTPPAAALHSASRRVAAAAAALTRRRSRPVERPVASFDEAGSRAQASCHRYLLVQGFPRFTDEKVGEAKRAEADAHQVFLESDVHVGDGDLRAQSGADAAGSGAASGSTQWGSAQHAGARSEWESTHARECCARPIGAAPRQHGVKHQPSAGSSKYLGPEKTHCNRSQGASESSCAPGYCR
eukprot:6174229-Pleurochrysis_carterae.AAC.4